MHTHTHTQPHGLSLRCTYHLYGIDTYAIPSIRHIYVCGIQDTYPRYAKTRYHMRPCIPPLLPSIRHMRMRDTAYTYARSISTVLIVGNHPPGVGFFQTEVRRRKYKLGPTKKFPVQIFASWARVYISSSTPQSERTLPPGGGFLGPTSMRNTTHHALRPCIHPPPHEFRLWSSRSSFHKNTRPLRLLDLFLKNAKT